MTHTSRLLAILFVLASSGCSLLIDTDPYLGEGRDAGPRDGAIDAAIDAMVDPDAPSAPAVHIEPSAPTTVDDLSVVIDTESVDPLAAGTVTYEYRWLRDGADASVTVDTVANAATAKGEVWRVEVRPVSADGMRRGAPGTAEVTIGNSAPVLLTVGLHQYFPVVGERISAIPGPTYDADGDTVSLRYQWFVNDAPVSGATTSALQLTGLTGSEALRLEAWPYDSEVEGSRVSVGPVTVAPDTTTWRQILPAPDLLSPIAYDSPHDRYVHFVDGGVWEYVATGDRVRAARLPVSGTAPPDERSDVFHDPVNRRLLVVTESDREHAYALDLENRGTETWSTIALAGTESPPFRPFATTWVDGASGTLWSFGGLGTAVGRDIASDELWSLSLEPGSESWTRHDVGGSTLPALLGAALAEDPTRPGSAVLIGGARTMSGTFVASDNLYRLDLGGVTAEQLPFSLPTGVIGAAAVALGGTVWLVGGIDAFDGTGASTGVMAVDIAAGTVTPSVSPALPLSVFAVAHRDPFRTDRVVFGPGSEPNFATFDVMVSDGSVTKVAELVRPPRLSHAAASVTNTSHVLLYGGREGDVSTTNGIVWDLHPTNETWMARADAGDSITGMTPEARWGVAAQSNPPRPSGVLFGGVLQDGTLASPDAWELRDWEARWLVHSLATGETPPEPREGPAVAGDGLCGGLFYVGGRRADGTVLGDAGWLDCSPTGDRDCAWRSVTAPSPRAYAAVGVAAGVGWLFGGLTSAGASGDLYRWATCSVPWTSVTATGTPPSARFAHSWSYVAPVGSDLPSFLMFGGASTEAETDRLGDLARLVITSSTTARWEVVSHTSSVVPKARAHHVSVWDEVQGRLLVYGGMGLDEYQPRGDLWELRVR